MKCTIHPCQHSQDTSEGQYCHFLMSAILVLTRCELQFDRDSLQQDKTVSKYLYFF